MDVEKTIMQFKMALLRKMPFYGDIVMRLPIIENNTIPTARTDGRKIEYNKDFLSQMTPGQCNFVIMHEVFHVLLFHCKRYGNRNPQAWNTAADLIVNFMLLQLRLNMDNVRIPFEEPVNGIFGDVENSDTVETLYEQIMSDNDNLKKKSKKIYIRESNGFIKVNIPNDLVAEDINPDVKGKGIFNNKNTDNSTPTDNFSERVLMQIIKESATKNRASFGSYFVPQQFYGLVESKRIKWQTLLRDYFSEDNSDEASYTTPERKYIHMDLILPGYSMEYEKIEELWAFVDSSGSISKNEMEQFLTQLYRISKEFKAVLNICYWNTEVTDVYRNILNESDILKKLPTHSGGTDINCVYNWLKTNKIKPEVMLILTDGYFGPLNRSLFVPSLSKKTILVLSGDIVVSDEMKIIGKIARLE